MPAMRLTNPLGLTATVAVVIPRNCRFFLYEINRKRKAYLIVLPIPPFNFANEDMPTKPLIILKYFKK